MKMFYQTPNGRLRFEIDVPTGKVAFQVAAGIAELFEEPNCGKCTSDSIRFDVREYDGNTYYKLTCMACGAQLDFGQKKDGVHLFAKRYDSENKKALPDRGWYIWQRKSESETSSRQENGKQEQRTQVREPEYSDIPF